MMIPTMIFLLFITLAGKAIGQEEYNPAFYENGMVFHEDFYAALPMIASNTTGDLESNHQGNLRRDLQSSSSCRATSPRNIYVCGNGGGGSADPCRDSIATCSGLTHDCTCTGSSETSCSYCQIRTANAILCQVTGSSTTFVDPTFKIMTCSCEYVGNGQVRQNCFQPTPRPVPFPTLPVPAPSPVAVRTPTTSSIPAPSLAIPVQQQPTQVPPPQASSPALPAPTPPPISATTTTTQTTTCRADNPFNLNLSVGSSCSAMPNYPCTCSGSTETSCSYCQVRTLNAIRCQVTGSDVTFLDPTGALMTCYCEYRGNGQVQEYCYQEAVANAVVRAPTAPVPWSPISQRSPSSGPGGTAPSSPNLRPVQPPPPASSPTKKKNKSRKR